jgi:hypothetical protein
MKMPQVELMRRLAVTAESRAAGAAWTAIAERLRCRPETCRRWPKRYAAAWRQLYADAVQELRHECEAETIRALRQMLRSKSERAQRDAAHELIALLRLRTQKPISDMTETNRPPFDDIADAYEALESDAPAAS